MVVLVFGAWLALAAGCAEHRVWVEPVEVKPIKVNVDVHIKVDRERDADVDRELEEIFDVNEEGGAAVASDSRTRERRSSRSR